ncbi:MAG TPA: chemotaxis protein CheB [Candidatus Eremiobacteraceae bacterium]|nr:chemotaxis protein CheB [Candidatus Eremiobacteraceae bacterium]
MRLAPATKAPVESFPVVCLGGSAGGLSAYKQILRELPADFNMAIVIVAHRARQNAMFLVPLLAKVTTMEVVEAKEGMRLQPNRVHVAPPQKAITTDGMVLRLKRTKVIGWPTSIDAFLFSLAKQCASQAIAIILSGMGYDGSVALQAIKDAGGVTFAQSDASWGSMPQSAVNTGHVDFVLTASEIGKQLAMMSEESQAAKQRS